jgi:hypothetical protein
MPRRRVPSKVSRIKKILRDVKYRCKKKGIDFDLKFEDFDVIPDYCPILGLEINYEGERGLCICSPSIDRINPTKGYTKDNVMIISYRANRIKSDATISELCSVISYVWRYYHADYVPQEGHYHDEDEDHSARGS